MRIISTVPSLTELLYDLGLEEEVVGITKFCTDPEHWYRNKKRIGGPKQLHLEEIKELQPDWIIASKEENIKEQIEYCAEFSNILLTDVANLEDALEMITDVGRVVQKEQKAENIRQDIETVFKHLEKQSSQRVVYMIWKDPLMSVGGDTFIHDMIQRCGWQNVFADELRYPSFSEAELKAINPDVVLLASEPYPFGDKHHAYFQRLLPQAKLVNVDGSYFTWYGSRLRYSVQYFQQIQQQIASM